MSLPERLGRYLLIRKIATGGMAEIFLAKLHGAEGFEKQVVIKRILPQWASDKDFITMLIDEAKISVHLNHPNIVQVYELAREGEAYYIAMEYLEGVDLRRLMQKANSGNRKVPLSVGLTVILGVLEGLAYAHSRRDSSGGLLGIVHRDISPQNILVSFDGTTKLTDFGIAKAALRSQETMTGVLKGKLAYMSPEQANQETLDARSDLYSTAIVLYELLTGERLFQKGSDIDTLDRVRRGQVTFSPQSEKTIPGQIREILLKALAKERTGRFPDIASFREEILKFARRTKRELRREEVGGFVSSLFAGEIALQAEEVTRPLSRTAEILPSRARRIPAGFKWAGVVFAVVVFGIIGIIFLPVMRTGERPPPVAPAATGTPLRDSNALAPAAVAVSAPKIEKGFLSVQAVPWGYVTLDGGGRRETPLRKVPLSAGNHNLQVIDGSSGAVASAKIQIASSKETVCVVNFQEERRIRCGK